MSASGNIQVNGENLANDDAIRPPARAAVVRDKDVRVVIKADGTVPHARIMHALDVLRLAGIAKVGFGVVPEKITRTP